MVSDSELRSKQLHASHLRHSYTSFEIFFPSGRAHLPALYQWNWISESTTGRRAPVFPRVLVFARG